MDGQAGSSLGKFWLPFKREEKDSPRDSGQCILSPFLDFLLVWPRLNYRKPCFDCHRRIPISRRVAHVVGTSYGVSRILYEFLSWSDSFICLSSIPPPTTLPPPPLPQPFHLSPFSLRFSLSTCFSFRSTNQTSLPRGNLLCQLDTWISRASKPASKLLQSECEN